MSFKSRKTRFGPPISTSKNVVTGFKNKGSMLFDEKHKFKGDRNDTRLLIDQLEAYAKTLIVPYFEHTANGLVERLTDENGWQYSGYHMLHSAEMCASVTVPTVARPNLTNLTEQQSRKITMELKFVEAESKNIRAMNEKRMATSSLLINWVNCRLDQSLVILVQNLAKQNQLTPASLFTWLKSHFSEQSHLEVVMAERRDLYEYCEATSMSAFVTTLKNRLAVFHQLPAEGPDAEHEYVQEQIANLSFNFILDSLMPERLKIADRYKQALDLLVSDSKAKECTSMIDIMELFMSKCESIERGRALAPVIMSAGALDVARGEDDDDSSSDKKKICFAFKKNGSCKRGDSCPYAHSKQSAGGAKNKSEVVKGKNPGVLQCSKEDPCGNLVCHFCRKRFAGEFREYLLNEEPPPVIDRDSDDTVDKSSKSSTAANPKKRQREPFKSNWAAKPPKSKKTGARFLDVQIDNADSIELDICVNAARVNIDDSGGLAMMDSGCSENVVPAEIAKLWGNIEHCSGSCRTVSGERLPIKGLVGLPGGLPGKACVVKGVKDVLLSVRAFTAMGVSICFPSTDLGTEWGFYGYRGDKIVLVGDFDYMVHLDHVVGTCDDMPAMVPPVFPNSQQYENNYCNALDVNDSEGSSDVDSDAPVDVVAGTHMGAAVSGAVSAGTAVAGPAAVDTASDISARAVDAVVSVAASTGYTGAGDPRTLPDQDLRTGAPHKVVRSKRARSGGNAVAADNAVANAVDAAGDHSVRVGRLHSAERSILTAGRSVTYATQLAAVPGNRGYTPRMLSDLAATHRLYTSDGVTPAMRRNGSTHDVAASVAIGNHAVMNRA